MLNPPVNPSGNAFFRRSKVQIQIGMRTKLSEALEHDIARCEYGRYIAEGLNVPGEELGREIRKIWADEEGGCGVRESDQGVIVSHEESDCS